MPRPQRNRGYLLNQPYRRRGDRCRAGLLTNGTCLPDDALGDIFTRLPDTADAVRCAATCARWASVVATRAAALSRSLPPLGRFLPELGVGFFCQENDRPAARTRGSLARFLTIMGSSGSRLLGRHHRSGIGSLFNLHGGDDDLDGETFDYSRLVASRSGHLVVELQRRRRTHGLTFCVCNPITGDVSVLPPLPGKDMPVNYACTLLTDNDDDLHPLGSATKFFRLLLVYNRRPGFTMLRCYASEVGNWGPEAKSSVDVTNLELRHVGPAVVLRGVAFWPVDHGALGVRLDMDAQDPNQQAMHAHLLPYEYPHYWPEMRLLGVSSDKRLFSMSNAIHADLNILCTKISYFEMQGGDFRTGRQEPINFEQRVLMHQMKMKAYGDISSLKLRWFGEKSGIVLFTMGESSGYSGTFTLHLRDETVQKVSDDGEGDKWKNLVGFEMDREAYLASLARGQES